MKNIDKTWMGYLAILLWGTAGAFTRSISEEVGTFTAGFIIYILGGLMMIYLTPRVRNEFVWTRPNINPILACGFFYVIYVLSTIYSIGISKTRLINLRVGSIHSLWPVFTLIFSIPILGEKKKLSITGFFFSFIGILVVVFGGSTEALVNTSIRSFDNVMPFIIGLLSAVSWAIYSNLVKKYGIENNKITGIFMLISGGLMAFFSLFLKEPQFCSWRVLYHIAYRVVVTLFLSTYLWNQSMVKGDIYKVAMAANFQPLISALFYALLLEVPLTPNIVLGGFLLVIGNILQNFKGKSFFI